MTAPALPLPERFQLAVDPDVRRPRGDVVVGGSPLRVLRFGEVAAGLFDRWEAGREVGPSPAAGRLARRLVESGIAHPRPPPGPMPDTTVVIPARDHHDGLRRTLDALSDLTSLRVIVVDDGSSQPVRIEQGAPACTSVVRLDPPGGPAAARNAGWRLADSEIVAFLDADCVPHDGWLNTLLHHFADPSVAAVAPRIISDASSGTNLAEYESGQSPLDRGPREAPVRPRSRVPYVPTACVAVRRRALVDLGGFNETLRFGEDVDLVWRLNRHGWSVRYEPAASVVHPPRSSLRAWSRQRFDYGGSAAQLAALHDTDVAPLDVSPWSAAAWMLAAAGHPIAGGTLVAGTSVALARRAGRDRETAKELVRLALRGNLLAGLRIAEAVRRAWLPPAILALAVIPPGRPRRRIAAALMAAFALPLTDWAVRRPPVDAATWAALRIGDDLAYQTGLWFGAAKKRSLKALLPRF